MVIVSRCLSTHVVGSTPTCYTPTTHTVPIPAKFCEFYSCGNEDCLKVVDPSIELDAAQKTAHIFIVTDAVFIIYIAFGIPFLIGFVLYILKSYSKNSKVNE